MSASSSPGSLHASLIPAVVFKKGVDPNFSQYDDIESVRTSNMARNQQVFRELGFVSPVPKMKLPVFSKRVVRISAEKRVVPQRTGKVSAVEGKLSTRTASKSGIWPCVAGCDFGCTKVKVFVDHLTKHHKFPLDTVLLAPLGLALCSFCGGVFESLRGIVLHRKACRSPHKSACKVVGGIFPRRCFVWWAAETKWYEGVAALSDDIDVFNVEYPAAIHGEQTFQAEFFHVVTFSTPPVASSEIRLPEGGASALSVPLSFSPISVG